MKTTKWFCLILLGFILGSCVNDKPTGNAEAAPDVQTEKRVTPPPPPSKIVTTNSAPSRPTENIKVNLPGNKKPAPSAQPNLGATQKNTPVIAATSEKRSAMSDEEKRMTREREAKQAEYERNNPVPKAKPKSVVAPKSSLPSACDLVTAEFISKTLGVVAARDIYVKDGSGKSAENARSCFFKWDDEGNVNAGVLLQIQKNPLPDEFPDWASYFIRAKRDQGDKMPDGSGTFRYKDFPGMGIAGAYNYDLARYTWRTETDNIFMVAFNLQSSEAEQLIWAEKIGKEAMRNFMKTKK